VTYSVLGGGNAVCIRFSNRELAPLWGASLRFTLAAMLLLAVVAVLRLKIPRGRALYGTLLYGAVTFGGAFALAYYAFVHVHAGFGQLVLALVPWRHRKPRCESLFPCLVCWRRSEREGLLRQSLATDRPDLDLLGHAFE
jgi:hypothetical protein